MDDLLIQRRMRMPVVTGVPTSPEAVRSSQPQTGTSFREVLEQEAQKTTELSFSRHAAGRVAERGLKFPAPEWSVWKKDSGWPGKRA